MLILPAHLTFSSSEEHDLRSRKTDNRSKQGTLRTLALFVQYYTIIIFEQNASSHQLNDILDGDRDGLGRLEARSRWGAGRCIFAVVETSLTPSRRWQRG